MRWPYICIQTQVPFFISFETQELTRAFPRHPNSWWNTTETSILYAYQERMEPLLALTSIIQHGQLSLCLISLCSSLRTVVYIIKLHFIDRAQKERKGVLNRIFAVKDFAMKELVTSNKIPLFWSQWQTDDLDRKVWNAPRQQSCSLQCLHTKISMPRTLLGAYYQEYEGSESHSVRSAVSKNKQSATCFSITPKQKIIGKNYRLVV